MKESKEKILTLAVVFLASVYLIFMYNFLKTTFNLILLYNFLQT